MTESETLAKASRRDILQMTHDAQAAHVGSSLSIVDILSVLYSRPHSVGKVGIEDRDLILVSKGHAAAATYAVLANSGIMPRSLLATYCKDGSVLGGHVTHFDVPGVEFSTGSLGHALSFGLGRALAMKCDGKKNRVFVILSDGECDEGSTWEAALLASHLGLNNVTVLIDRNFLQSLGNTEATVRLEPLNKKWEAFNWRVSEIDGHSHFEISAAIEDVSEEDSRPHIIICKTVKGFGVSFMENQILWHYKSPSAHELAMALAEIDNT